MSYTATILQQLQRYSHIFDIISPYVNILLEDLKIIPIYGAVFSSDLFICFHTLRENEINMYRFASEVVTSCKFLDA